ncbi:MAG: tRNA ((37)-N6)-threonylcarbamoyltransferase complex dimerization subunit type 1 TsaB [Actinomycetota bacterium]
MKILALDTSTSRVTVALTDSETLVNQLHGGELTGAQFHGELLAGLVMQCLGDLRPDAIAVGRGPGPYTGLRVGITTAEVLAAAWEIPVVGVPTLQALAHGHIRRGGSAGVACLDVKRKEIAAQSFDAHGSMTGDPHLVHINDIDSLADQHLVGPAFITQTQVQPVVSDDSPVDAFDIALIAHHQFASGNLESSQPLYLRAPDAAEPAPRKTVL